MARNRKYVAAPRLTAPVAPQAPTRVTLAEVTERLEQERDYPKNNLAACRKQLAEMAAKTSNSTMSLASTVEDLTRYEAALGVWEYALGFVRDEELPFRKRVELLREAVEDTKDQLLACSYRSTSSGVYGELELIASRAKVDAVRDLARYVSRLLNPERYELVEEQAAPAIEAPATEPAAEEGPFVVVLTAINASAYLSMVLRGSVPVPSKTVSLEMATVYPTRAEAEQAGERCHANLNALGYAVKPLAELGVAAAV